MIEQRIKPSVITYNNNTMIDVYAKKGMMAKAKEMFASMKSDGIMPDIYTYNSMIYAYLKDGQMFKAIELFTSMNIDGMKPDVVTYNSIIDAYSKDGQMDKAIEMLASMKREGMKPNVVTYQSLLNCYAKNGNHLDDMFCILKEMKDSSIVPKVHTWTNILDGFSRARGEKDQKKALSIWQYLSGQQSFESLGMPDLPLKGIYVFPDALTLSIAIDVCKHGQFEKEAHEVWNYGQENDRIVLESNLLASYIRFLFFLGEKGADRVVDLILRGIKEEKMPLRCVKPDKKTLANAKKFLKSMVGILMRPS
jgi:pentatricopeptide repeat protein